MEIDSFIVLGEMNHYVTKVNQQKEDIVESLVH